LMFIHRDIYRNMKCQIFGGVDHFMQKDNLMQTDTFMDYCNLVNAFVIWVILKDIFWSFSQGKLFHILIFPSWILICALLRLCVESWDLRSSIIESRFNGKISPHNSCIGDTPRVKCDSRRSISATKRAENTQCKLLFIDKRSASYRDFERFIIGTIRGESRT
jgi:hypothetical protein